MVRFGQLRSTSFTGAKAWYLVAGVCNMALFLEIVLMDEILRKCGRQVLALFALFVCRIGR
jgi:hypothetical protein